MKAFVVLLAAMTSNAAYAAAAPRGPNFDCTRHVYNNSSGWWTIGYVADSGSATMICTSAGRAKAKAKHAPANYCAIAPGGTVAVGFYLDSNEQVYGTVYLSDPYGNANNWPFLGFGGIGGAGCPYIHHNGSTAGVNLNEPANGDMQLFGALGRKTAAQRVKEKQTFDAALSDAKRKAAMRHHH